MEVIFEFDNNGIIYKFKNPKEAYEYLLTREDRDEKIQIFLERLEEADKTELKKLLRYMKDELRKIQKKKNL